MDDDQDKMFTKTVVIRSNVLPALEKLFESKQMELVNKVECNTYSKFCLVFACFFFLFFFLILHRLFVFVYLLSFLDVLTLTKQSIEVIGKIASHDAEARKFVINTGIPQKLVSVVTPDNKIPVSTLQQLTYVN